MNGLGTSEPLWHEMMRLPNTLESEIKLSPNS